MKLNRRSFLKSTAAGVALGGVASLEAAEKNRDPHGLLIDEQPRRRLNPEGLLFNKGNPFEGRVRDQSWRGVEGVVVTNGRDSVKTDSKGNYRLPVWEETRFISITIPSGYVCTEWYYDAWNRFDQDFQILAKPELKAGGCKFIHIADSEISSPQKGEQFVRNLKALGEREQVAFYVHTGDINGNLGMKAHFQLMTDYTMGRPVFYCLGNHDMVSTWPYGEAEFESLFGPSWHSFDVGGVHFVVTPMDATRGDRPGGFTEDDIADWLRGDLALVDKKTPVVFFNHYFCNCYDVEKRGLVYGNARPLDLTKACNLKGWVYGHSHNTWVRHQHGVPMLNSSNPNKGGIDHSPNVARVIAVSETGEITSKSFFGDYSEFRPKSVACEWETALAAGVPAGGMLDGGKLIYVTSNDDDNLGTAWLYALCKATGKTVWKTKLGNTVKGALALASGKVIGVDVEGLASAYEAETGKLAWQLDLMKSGQCNYTDMVAHGAVASPDGTRVAVGIGRCQHVLDARTGAVIWKNGGNVERCSIAVTPAFTDKYLLTPYNWGPFMCNDAATGKVLWKFGSFNFPGAQPYVLGDTVLLGDGPVMIEFDLATGKELQRSVDKGRRFGCPGDILVVDGLVLKGAVDGGLVALDRQDLKRTVWTASVAPGLASSSEYGGMNWRTLNTTPVRFGKDQVCAAAIDGRIHFWKLADGKEVRSIDTGVPYLASVLVAGNAVYAADMSGRVRCIKV